MKKNIQPQISKDRWALSFKRLDSTKFFEHIHSIIKGCDSVYIEGTAISEKAAAFYKLNSLTSDFLPGVSAISPKSETFCCRPSSEFWTELTRLSKDSAETDLFDHFFVYKKAMPILEWWDAFSDNILVSLEISETEIYNFAARLGLHVQKMRG
jgi:hypothetical protein